MNRGSLGRYTCENPPGSPDLPAKMTPAGMTDPKPKITERRWRALEWSVWPLAAVINMSANSVTAWMDQRRTGNALPLWEPFVWEASSSLLLLVLVPAVAWFTRLFPLHWDTWRRHLPWHAFASIAFSLVHVTGMVALRKLAYALNGAVYDFGDWRPELIYEYLKDVRTYALLIAVMEGYRFLRRRLHGEARLLSDPDEGPSLEPVERPERFLVRKLNREFLVAAADIEWLQAAGNYVNLHVRGHDYPLRSTLTQIELRLDSAAFIRVHRSFMVNLNHIVSFETLDSDDGRIHMRDKSVVPFTRRYRETLRARVAA